MFHPDTQFHALNLAITRAYQSYRKRNPPHSDGSCCGYVGPMYLDEDRGGWWACSGCGMI